MTSPPSLETRLKGRARELGFARVGIARAGPADGFDRYQEWLARGYAGEMAYLERHAQAREHPKSILPDVRSVIMLAWNYAAVRPGTAADLPYEPEQPTGRIARYAQGPDYHDTLRARLRNLLDWLRSECPEIHGRGVVDTAPLLERDFARRAGLGWIGKNTLLIDKHLGSYLLLAALLVDRELQPDPPHEHAHCGTCTACLDVCPTRAFEGPGWLDARKCIAYLTIERRSPIPEDLRTGVGDWLFGCDLCQEVCPWNRHADADVDRVDARAILGLSEEEFRARFRGTTLFRSGRAGLARNAAIVLGNSGDASALPALRAALGDPDEDVRNSVSWAIEKIVKKI